jgi:hypothetical protein
VGTGSYVPERVLTNEELSESVQTTDEWITTRTGIKTRRIAAKDEHTSDMAARAAIAAMEQAQISAEEIDLILVATASPDMIFPATACFVQTKIGAVNAACLDVSAGLRRLSVRARDRTAIRHFTRARHRAGHRRGEAQLDHELDRSQHLRALRRWRRCSNSAAPRERARHHQHARRQQRQLQRHPLDAGGRLPDADHGENAHQWLQTIHMSGKTSTSRRSPR